VVAGFVFSSVSGYMAGLVTTSAMTGANREKKVGMVIAQQYPVMDKAIRPGFERGFKDVDPAITLDVRVIGNWYDAAKAAELAQSMFDAGVDVVLSIAGGANQGVVKAARERGRYVLWFDSNGYAAAPGTVVGSSVVAHDEATYRAVKAFLSGKLELGKPSPGGGRRLREVRRGRPTSTQAVVSHPAAPVGAGRACAAAARPHDAGAVAMGTPTSRCAASPSGIREQVLANDRVDFEVRLGEIHALVGRTGPASRRSDIDGLVKSPTQEIAVVAERDDPLARDAMRHGSAWCTSTFASSRRSVAENVVLSIEPCARLFMDEGRPSSPSRTAHRFDLPVEPAQRSPSWTWASCSNVAQAPHRNAASSCSTSPRRSSRPAGRARCEPCGPGLRGRTVVVVTHGIGGAEVADRMTVLRGGASSPCRAAPAPPPARGAMVAPPPPEQGDPGTRPPCSSCRASRCRRVGPASSARPHGALRRDRRSDARGQRPAGTEDAVSGCGSRPRQILHRGRQLDAGGRHAFRRRDLAYVPSQRFERGASLSSTVEENMMLGRRESFGPCGLFRAAATRSSVLRLIKEFSTEERARAADGDALRGNRQKVILARELGSGKDFVLFAEPTWGIDVAASVRAPAHPRLRDQGRAILLISSDLQEILQARRRDRGAAGRPRRRRLANAPRTVAAHAGGTCWACARTRHDRRPAAGRTRGARATLAAALAVAVAVLALGRPPRPSSAFSRALLGLFAFGNMIDTRSPSPSRGSASRSASGRSL
jgi:ABC-type branched-subunit amino acid transport system ATPase component